MHPRGVGIYATDETPDGIEARLAATQGASDVWKEWIEYEKKDRRKRWRGENVFMRPCRLVRQFLSQIISERL